IGGPIRKNKTFFFLDGEQKDQLHAITFTGLVPAAQWHTSATQPYADFGVNAFGQQLTGAPVIINPYLPPNAADPFFQCTGTAANPGPPTAVNPNGSQVPGVDCGKIPAALINPLGAALVNRYLPPNANDPAAGINF